MALKLGEELRYGSMSPIVVSISECTDGLGSKLSGAGTGSYSTQPRGTCAAIPETTHGYNCLHV